MAALKTFLFDYDFDDAKLMRQIVEEESSDEKKVEETVETEPEIAPPTFSEAELDAARQKAFNEGKESGNSDALAGIENSTSQALNTIVAEIMELSQKQSEFNEKVKIETISLLNKVIGKLFPLINERMNVDEVLQFSERILPGLLAEPRIIFRVPKNITETLKNKIEPILKESGYDGELIVNGDTEFSAGTCMVEWSSGSAERNTELLLSEIEQHFVTAINNDSFASNNPNISKTNVELSREDETLNPPNETLEDPNLLDESSRDENTAPKLDHGDRIPVEENMITKDSANEETDKNS
jgi:flagellar biosynthesis/type III secretory pathway protein FliH